MDQIYEDKNDVNYAMNDQGQPVELGFAFDDDQSLDLEKEMEELNTFEYSPQELFSEFFKDLMPDSTKSNDSFLSRFSSQLLNQHPWINMFTSPALSTTRASA